MCLCVCVQVAFNIAEVCQLYHSSVALPPSVCLTHYPFFLFSVFSPSSMVRGEAAVVGRSLLFLVLAVGGDPGVTGRRAIVARLHSHANVRADTRTSARILASASSFREY